jgi:hypothetical protein
MTPQEAMRALEDAFDDDRIDVYVGFSTSLKDDLRVFHKLLDVAREYQADALHVASSRVRKDFGACMRACLLHVESFRDVDQTLRRQSAFVLPIVEAHKASSEFLDQKYVKQVVKDCPAALRCLSSYHDNYDVALAAVGQDGAALAFCSESLKSNAVLVVAALSSNGLALEFAPSFQDDQAMTVLACFQNGLALKFATLRLQRDVVVVRIATRQNFQACLFVKDMKHSCHSCDDLVDQNPLYLEFCPVKSRILVEKAVTKDGMALQHAGCFRFDKSIVLKAATQNRQALQYSLLNEDIALNTLPTNYYAALNSLPTNYYNAFYPWCCNQHQDVLPSCLDTNDDTNMTR